MSACTVDLILFAGQSNMAGRGIVCDRFPQEAPAVIPGAGWEYRAISDPTRPWPVTEPFGVNENNPDGIHETIKTGSMVSSFVNIYYEETGVPVVGVSASKGGSVIAEWQPGGAYLTDALDRLASAREWLTAHGSTIRHTLVLWCQGESDGDVGTSQSDYEARFDAMLDEMVSRGIEQLLMVRIGRCNIAGSYDRYDRMIEWQDELAASRPRVTMVSRGFADLRERGLMKDSYHYYQQGYNETGEEAGRAAAAWVKTR